MPVTVPINTLAYDWFTAYNLSLKITMPNQKQGFQKSLKASNICLFVLIKTLTDS